MKNRRKKLTVDSAVQWALVRRVLWHWVYFLVLTATMLPLWMAVMSWDVGEKSFSIRGLLVLSCVRVVPVLLFFIGLAPLIVYDVLKLSHGFVGPIYQLHKAMEKVAAGEEIAPLRLRAGDFWQDVIADFNGLAQQVASLRQREPTSAGLEPATCGPPEAEGRWDGAST
jgi:hypothetical protein